MKRIRHRFWKEGGVSGLRHNLGGAAIRCAAGSRFQSLKLRLSLLLLPGTNMRRGLKWIRKPHLGPNDAMLMLRCTAPFWL